MYDSSDGLLLVVFVICCFGIIISQIGKVKIIIMFTGISFSLVVVSSFILVGVVKYTMKGMFLHLEELIQLFCIGGNYKQILFNYSYIWKQLLVFKYLFLFDADGGGGGGVSLGRDGSCY
jgi:hypothetical protein